MSVHEVRARRVLVECNEAMKRHSTADSCEAASHVSKPAASELEVKNRADDRSKRVALRPSVMCARHVRQPTASFELRSWSSMRRSAKLEAASEAAAATHELNARRSRSLSNERTARETSCMLVVDCLANASHVRKARCAMFRVENDAMMPVGFLRWTERW